MKVEVGSHMAVYKPGIKYVGMIIHAKLSFIGHLEYACQQVANAIPTLARMLASVDGLKHC